MPIRLPQSALPGVGEKPGAGDEPDGDGQSVPPTSSFGGLTAPEIRPEGGKTAQTDEITHFFSQNQRKMAGSTSNQT